MDRLTCLRNALTLTLLLAGIIAGTAAAQDASRPANRLKDATSPYLLQHAHNPVDWYPWGEEAFARAAREGKPIFLSIGYAACHWCHVMERESFQDEGIARQLNDHFIAIKVDREERPDVDEIYMTAVQTLTGRGGWPLSVFLTPEGKPFHGGTYFPRADFAELLRQVHAAWADPEKRAQVEKSAERLSATVGEAVARPGRPGSLAPSILPAAARALLERADPEHGGFGTKPKFPSPLRLLFLLREHARKPDPEALKSVCLALDRMARGGLYDQVGGGFHRYSVDQKWLAPHFEKMLYDNALLAAAYLEAHRATKDPYYRRIGKETLYFCLRELRDAKGAFHSSLDADSAGPDGAKEEGRFYLWTPDEVAAVLGPADGEQFCRAYGITPAGNFEKRSIPNLLNRSVEEWAKAWNTTPEALWARMDGMRLKLREARERRPRPALDDKVLANWNGLMLSALALGYEVTGETQYRTAAEEAARFLLKEMRLDTEGRLVHSWRAGKTQPQAFLEDYAFLANGLLDLHRVTTEARWLDEAAALSRQMAADFRKQGDGTFFLTPHNHEPLLARPSNPVDNITPSGPGAAALVLVRLARLTGDTELRGMARSALDAYATDMKRYPMELTGLLLAAQAHFTAGTEAPVTSADPVSASLEGVPARVTPGEVFEVTVRVRVRDGWHVNADRVNDDALIPTRVELAPGPFELLSAAYPDAKELRAPFSKQPLRVFAGEFVIRLRVKPLPGAERVRDFRLRLRYQSCDDRSCLRPTERLLTAPINSTARR